MISLLLASAAMAVSQPAPSQGADKALMHLYATAYVVGRCRVHLSPDSRLDFITKVNSLDKELAEDVMHVYFQGDEDTRKKPISVAVCRRALATAEAQLEDSR